MKVVWSDVRSFIKKYIVISCRGEESNSRSVCHKILVSTYILARVEQFRVYLKTFKLLKIKFFYNQT